MVPGANELTDSPLNQCGSNITDDKIKIMETSEFCDDECPTGS